MWLICFQNQTLLRRKKNPQDSRERNMMSKFLCYRCDDFCSYFFSTSAFRYFKELDIFDYKKATIKLGFFCSQFSRRQHWWRTNITWFYTWECSMQQFMSRSCSISSRTCSQGMFNECKAWLNMPQHVMAPNLLSLSCHFSHKKSQDFREMFCGNLKIQKCWLVQTCPYLVVESTQLWASDWSKKQLHRNNFEWRLVLKFS